MKKKDCMADKMDEKALQQKYMEFQVIQQQIEQLQQQLHMLNQQLQQLELTKNNLNELKSVETGTKSYAQIAPGIYVQSTVANTETLLVNVGANTTVEKSVPDTISLVEEQEKLAAENINETDKVLQQLSTDAMKIYEQLQNVQ
tara:strand:+ start:1892 stop:2323 length:432 start_codon:yes stop_codon:yes gene_type:complete